MLPGNKQNNYTLRNYNVESDVKIKLGMKTPCRIKEASICNNLLIPHKIFTKKLRLLYKGRLDYYS